MANKAEARKEMERAGLPVLPGSEAPLATLEDAHLAARETGYPVALKAAAGGGGRGIVVAHDERELAREFDTTRSEARALFGNDELYLERFLPRCRHVEMQVLGDGRGAILHLAERECSIQRRHQKIIEEAPCESIGQDLRLRLGEAAVRGARTLGYTSAGTLEFLVDDGGRFYFLEMNTRVQVEHGITELVTGIDIVKEQLLIAGGEPLAITQEDVVVSGHAIECRVTAETGPDFRPVTGTVDELLLPGGPGVRVDTHLYPGYTIPAHYDSLLAKVMAHGHDREEALGRMRRALSETVIGGVPTTLPFLQGVLIDPVFCSGHVYTDYVASKAS
jgi:acetyl-CoA carboxylase biotin carboxylase subunit